MGEDLLHLDSDGKRGNKKRGSYNCGRCGLPKKGHSCTIAVDPTAGPVIAPLRRHRWDPRRALSFVEEVEEGEGEGGEEVGEAVEVVSGPLPWGCLVGVLRRLAPAALMSAAQVCRGWRDCSRRIWRSAEELRMRVPTGGQLGFVGSVLQKCPELVRLSLRFERFDLCGNLGWIWW